MKHDDTVVMDIVFQPPQVKSYSVDMCMVCDNCNVKYYCLTLYRLVNVPIKTCRVRNC